MRHLRLLAVVIYCTLVYTIQVDRRKSLALERTSKSAASVAKVGVDVGVGDASLLGDSNDGEDTTAEAVGLLAPNSVLLYIKQIPYNIDYLGRYVFLISLQSFVQQGFNLGSSARGKFT